MSSSRTPFLAALAFVTLFVVGTSIVGEPPKATDSGDQVVAWLRDNAGDVQAGTLLFALGLIPFLVLATAVRAALPAPYGFAFLASVGAFVAQTAVFLWFPVGLALHADSLDPATARTVFDVGSFYGPLLTVTDVVMAGAVALAVFRFSALPRWVGWLSVLFALEQLAESATIFGDAGFSAPGGDWNAVLGAGLFGLWVLALGVAVSRRPGVAEPAPAPA